MSRNGVADALLSLQRRWKVRPPSKRTGRFEGVRNGRLCGWTFDARQPGQRLAVTILTEQCAIECIADDYRADVQLATGADGICGFAMPIDSGSPGTVRCVWADSGVDLPGSPWREQPSRQLSFATGSLAGSVRVDRDQGVISGFVLDRDAPLRRSDISLESGDMISVTMRASLYEPRSQPFGSDGFHGFRFALPARRKEAALRIRDCNSGVVLTELTQQWLRGASG